VGDVGARPSDDHQLRRPDPTKPWSKENSEWLLRVPGGRNGKFGADYAREALLRKKYGLTLADYEWMLADQGGVCYICGKKETRIIKGKLASLSVDHCHDEGHVRGLLCYKCNTAIGLLDHSLENLQRAVAYLKRDKATLAGQGQMRPARPLEPAGVDGKRELLKAQPHDMR
jgi:hypothetical protein